MENYKLRKLKKAELLQLPLFSDDKALYSTYSVKNLKDILSQSIKDLKLTWSKSVKDFKKAYKNKWDGVERERRERYEAQLRKEDDDFFNSLSQMKQQKRQQKLNRNEYKRSLKESALMNVKALTTS